MRGTPPIQRRPITDALRASVVEDLPEINDIKDAELRAKVIEGWAFSLAGSSYQRISDMPGEGNPDVLVLKRGDQTDHLRGVAHFAMKMRRGVRELASRDRASTATSCSPARSATISASPTSSIR